MTSPRPKALVLSGYGINCDAETEYALRTTGFDAERIHINELIARAKAGRALEECHLLAVDGGFAWGDDHGAGVLLALKLRSHLGTEIERFIQEGRLIIGICNGFQALVNMGLLPALDNDYRARTTALCANECGNFRDDWVRLLINEDAPCVFTRGVKSLELPVRHGEGKFYAPPETLNRLRSERRVVMRYAAPVYGMKRRRQAAHDPLQPTGLQPAEGLFPHNPNGSLDDIAGICDETGRVFGLMPHPEAFHHFTNHPQWTRRLDRKLRWNLGEPEWEGEGLVIFHNARRYIEDNLL